MSDFNDALFHDLLEPLDPHLTHIFSVKRKKRTNQ